MRKSHLNQSKTLFCLPLLLTAMACGDVSDQDLSEDLLGTVQQQLAMCQPAANECSFFVDANYGGSCVNVGPGRYHQAWGSGMLPNDTISSAKCGANVTFKGCTDSYFRGRCTYALDPVTNLNFALEPLNDKISSIEVFSRGIDQGPVRSDQVRIWADPGIPSRAPLFGNNGVVSVLHWGDYFSSAAFGLADNSISAFEVGLSAKVWFCRKPSLDTSDTCEAFGPGVYRNMNGLVIGNDTISSLSVALPF